MSLFSPPPTATGAPFGLRQRRDTHSTSDTHDENDNPNNLTQDTAKVRAPPRVFLATSGKSALRSSAIPAAPSTTVATTAISQAVTTTAATPTSKDEPHHWILAYGFRNHSQYAALLRRLEQCGSITSSRGGIQSNSNWVALRYSSALAARKAMCQNGSFVSVGGSTMVMGVQLLSQCDAVARLGIDIYGKGDDSMYQSVRETKVVDDSEVLLIQNGEDECETTGMDSVCSKVLAWFFMW